MTWALKSPSWGFGLSKPRVTETPPELIYQEPFDNFDFWTIAGPTIVPDGVVGTCAQFAGGNTADFTIFLDYQKNAIKVGFWWKATVVGASFRLVTQLRAVYNTNTNIASMQIDPNGAFIVRNGGISGSSIVGQSANGAATTNTWHYIELSAAIGPAPLGYIKAWLNGVQFCDATGIDTRNGTTNAFFSQIHLNGPGSGSIGHFDELTLEGWTASLISQMPSKWSCGHGFAPEGILKPPIPIYLDPQIIEGQMGPAKEGIAVTPVGITQMLIYAQGASRAGNEPLRQLVMKVDTFPGEVWRGVMGGWGEKIGTVGETQVIGEPGGGAGGLSGSGGSRPGEPGSGYTLLYRDIYGDNELIAILPGGGGAGLLIGSPYGGDAGGTWYGVPKYSVDASGNLVKGNFPVIETVSGAVFWEGGDGGYFRTLSHPDLYYGGKAGTRTAGGKGNPNTVVQPAATDGSSLKGGSGSTGFQNPSSVWYLAGGGAGAGVFGGGGGGTITGATNDRYGGGGGAGSGKLIVGSSIKAASFHSYFVTDWWRARFTFVYDPVDVVYPGDVAGWTLIPE